MNSKLTILSPTYPSCSIDSLGIHLRSSLYSHLGCHVALCARYDLNPFDPVGLPEKMSFLLLQVGDMSRRVENHYHYFVKSIAVIRLQRIPPRVLPEAATTDIPVDDISPDCMGGCLCVVKWMSSYWGREMTIPGQKGAFSATHL